MYAAQHCANAVHSDIASHDRLLLQAPTAKAFACSLDGHILAVSSSADILAMGNHLTKRVDLQGSFVTPVCLTTVKEHCFTRLCIAKSCQSVNVSEFRLHSTTWANI